MKWIKFTTDNYFTCFVGNRRRYKISEVFFSDGDRKEFLCEYQEKVTTIFKEDEDSYEENQEWDTDCLLGHTTKLAAAKKLCKTHFEGVIKDLQEMLNEV